MSRAVLYCGDARAILSRLPNQSVQMVCTSPPYWSLRDYGVSGQYGLERTPEEHVEKMVAVFREVRRVLRDDGVLWLNVGDSYAAGKGKEYGNGRADLNWTNEQSRLRAPGLKPKDLVGIPWMLAFALRADGWWLRSDIIWSKPNPMPESVLDRPTRAHEYVFLLSKSARYFYDAAAIRTPLADKTFTTFGTKHQAQGNDGLGGVKSDNWGRTVKTRKPKEWKVPAGWDTDPGAHGAYHRNGRAKPDKQRGHGRRHEGFNDRWDQMEREGQISYGANARSVWEIAPQNYPEAHFATFPEELARRCILAGSKPGDTVLDPFGGSGTVAQVATGNGRDAIYIDLNPAYLELARQRIGPMLCDDPELVA